MLFNLVVRFRNFIPQGSVRSALVNQHMIASLSNCVVVPPVYDSYGGICYTDEQLAHLFKRRCGVGVDISGLRPRNAKVSNAAGTRSEEHTSELQSLMRISSAVFCLKKQQTASTTTH